MKSGLKIWRASLNAVLGPLESFLDKSRRKKSFERPVICGHGRGSLRYYENGRYVVIEAELMSGSSLDRRIHRSSILEWDDNRERLSDEDAVRVFQNLCDYLDQKNVRWKFSDVD